MGQLVSTVESHPVALALLMGLALFYGVLKLFEKLDTLVSKDLRETIALLVLTSRPPRGVDSWTQTFPAVFDSVFGIDKRSWRFLRRSCLASFSAVAVLLIAYRLLPRESSVFSTSDLIFFAAFVNLIPDYLSLLQSRYILGRMEQSSNHGQVLAWLAMDLVLSTIVFWIAGVVIGTFVWVNASLLIDKIDPSVSASDLEIAWEHGDGWW